ncbi:MAG: HlyD family efflux transporter periplasmic adaptor subunit [Pseudorhodobacter sp.]|nr:HlyD family efflux transporter periplasmic adaptor subunit [Pseudorhodobacter sp.]
MRYFRLVLGSLIIVLAIWLIVGEQMTGASADAVVNARLSMLRAPIAGTIAMPSRGLGSSVSLGEEVASVTDPLVDGVRMNDLEMERGFLAAGIARLKAEIETAATQIAELSGRGKVYHAERVAEIETRLSHAKARLGLLEQGARADGQLTGLLEEGQSGIPGDPHVPEIALDYARERVAVLEIALRAAQADVFLGDGYNDAPFSEQRRNELETAQEGLLAELAEAKARLATVEARIGAERQRTTKLGGAVLTATVNGQVWEVLAGNGETVQRGQDVLRLLDCDAPLVTVSVTEGTYNRLRIGDNAVFRLNGDGRSLPASVIRLGGTGAATFYQNLAIAPSLRHLERFDVALSVPALQSEPALRCTVGRTGRAFFDARPMDWLRDLWR